METKIIVAIDGFSSCGKSTMAKQLAKKLHYLYIDTGAMYRAVALYALRLPCVKDGELDKDSLIAHLPAINIDFCQRDGGLPEVCLNGENIERDIRGLAVSNLVSVVAALPAVRSKMIEQQRHLARNKGVVMDGRDIGTVVFPDAELKIFVTADASIRAQRRYDELVAKQQEVSYDEILKNIEMRDKMDLTRAVGPLRQAEDALILDNGNMSIEEQNAWLEEAFNKRLACLQ